LKFSEEIIFGKYVTPVCLPSPKLSLKQFSNLTITGWGKINFEAFSTSTTRGPESLKQGLVPIVPTHICQQEKVLTVYLNK